MKRICLLIGLAASFAAMPFGPTLAQTVEPAVTVFRDARTDPYDRTNYYGFNHAPSVTHLGNGRVMAAWFSAPYEASVHQLIVGAISEDGGRSWGRMIVLNDAPRTSDFDPAFIDAGDRTLLFFSTGRWTRWPFVGIGEEARRQVGVESFRIHMRASDDGVTWTEPITLPSEPGWNCRSNGLRLSNGTLLLPLHHLAGPHQASVLLSTDNGETWERGPEIVTPGRVGAAEPTVTELPGGQLLMALRSRDGKLWMTRSDDHGRTWTEPEPSGLPGAASSANLFTTRAGTVVLTHNPTTKDRTQLTLRTSDDGGQTWGEPVMIAQVEPADGGEVYSRQVSYPSVCELDDGTLLVVWTEIELGAQIQSGVIRASRVRLDG